MSLRFYRVGDERGGAWIADISPEAAIKTAQMMARIPRAGAFTAMDQTEYYLKASGEAADSLRAILEGNVRGYLSMVFKSGHWVWDLEPPLFYEKRVNTGGQAEGLNTPG
jgi:hypothetical protein